MLSYVQDVLIGVIWEYYGKHIECLQHFEELLIRFFIHLNGNVKDDGIMEVLMESFIINLDTNDTESDFCQIVIYIDH